MTVAEPFLEKYAQRSPKNRRLVGAAGSAVNVEQFLAEMSGERSEEEDDAAHAEDETPSTSSASDATSAKKAKGMLVFFPGKNVRLNDSLRKMVIITLLTGIVSHFFQPCFSMLIRDMRFLYFQGVLFSSYCSQFSLLVDIS